MDLTGMMGLFKGVDWIQATQDIAECLSLCERCFIKGGVVLNKFSNGQFEKTYFSACSW
jgi:hypothetical protein